MIVNFKNKPGVVLEQCREYKSNNLVFKILQDQKIKYIYKPPNENCGFEKFVGHLDYTHPKSKLKGIISIFMKQDIEDYYILTKNGTTLHREDGPAYSLYDGNKIYYVHGVGFAYNKENYQKELERFLKKQNKWKEINLI